MLDTVLLGLLRQPASGYDLRGELAAGAWPAELSQVYQSLRRLEARGWLAGETLPSARGPARRVYELTPDGEAELLRRLRAGPALAPERRAWLAQVRFLAYLDPREARDWLGRLLARLEDEVSAAERHEARWTDAPLGDEGSFARAAAGCALAEARARRDWARATLARLEVEGP